MCRQLLCPNSRAFTIYAWGVAGRERFPEPKACQRSVNRVLPAILEQIRTLKQQPQKPGWYGIKVANYQPPKPRNCWVAHNV
jgi:hypothetical protein